MAPRRNFKSSSALLIALCSAALTLPVASTAADSDYNTRSTTGGSSSDMPPSGNTGATTNDASSPSGSTSGGGSSSDADTNRSSSGGYVKDAYITAKVKAALARDRDVTARNIRVETDGQGVVTLSGQAKSQAEADKAVADARSVDGVTSVTNNIQVR